MFNLKTRIALILALVAASVFMLFPRTTVERVRRNGVIVYDTVHRVPLKRGLDLQGGMHLALEVDESRGTVANKSEALDRALKVVRTRVDEFGVSEPVVQKSGDERIIVELPGIDDPDRAVALVQKSAFLQFQIVDKSGAMQRVLPRLDAIVKSRAPQIAAVAGAQGAAATPARPSAATSLFAGADTGSARDTTKRADSTTVASGDSARDTGAVAVTTDGPFSGKIQGGQIPGQFYVASSDFNAVQSYLELQEVRDAIPPGKVLKWGTDTLTLGDNRVYRPLYMLDSRPIITGEYLTDARPQQDPMEGTVVTFTLNNVGGRRFKTETAKHIQDNMAIVLDERVITAPTLQSSIGTSGQITLGRGDNVQEAQDLALILRAGALPVPLKVAEVRNIGASLGQDSIDAGMRALAIAVLLIVVIMVVYYRFSGMLAVGALLLYMLYTMAVLAGFDAVLTLPGLAGLILSIGIAVDANVLIFERIREELDRGKTTRTAIDEGFKHALSAIVDTSVTTILTAAILYQYGTGPVRGFAVTLIAGILASMFTAIFVTRTFYLIWLSRARAGQALSI